MITQLSARWMGAALGAASLLIPYVVVAQSSSTQLQGLGLSFSGSDLFAIIARVINGALLIAGVVVLAYLLYGGFQYVTAGGDEDKAGTGRKAITNAIIGVVIIVAALAIVTFLRSSLAVQNRGGSTSVQTTPSTTSSPGVGTAQEPR